MFSQRPTKPYVKKLKTSWIHIIGTFSSLYKYAYTACADAYNDVSYQENRDEQTC
jgi:hypothetical protein